MRAYFWTEHSGSPANRPLSAELSGLHVGRCITLSDDAHYLVLRRIFESWEEGKKWMDEVFHRRSWEDSLREFEALDEVDP